MKATSRLLCLVLALMLLLSACGSEPSDPNVPDDGEVKDTLIVGNIAEPTVLDPPNQQNAASGLIDVQIYDGLVRQNNETGEIDPCLATSWEYVDDYTIRFYLRDDVYFHDGSKFTAEDVKFTFDRGATCSMKAMIFEPFDTSKTKIIDEYTIELGTKDVFPPMLTYLTNNGALIVSKSAVEAAGSDDVYGRNPVGTGAYKFVDWLAGDRVILERNEDYWGEAPEFKNLIIRTMADETTRAMALENGEIDIAVGLGASQIDMLNSSETASVITFPSYITQYCGLNCSYEPLSDKRVRQALRYAVDMDTITEIAYSNGVVADGPFVPTISSYVPAGEDQQYEQDIEKAKQLLKEAGYENGFDLEISVNENQARITIAEMLANAWSEIGINATVSTLEFSAIVSDMYSGNTQAFIMGFGAGGNDGDFYASPFHSEGDTSVWIGYSNPEVDRLFDLAGSELDEDLRNSYYAEVQTVLRDDLPWLWLRFTDNIFGMQKNLTGLDLDPETYCEFRFVKSA
jgi:peptide/nickel transport system substrate-binding protein